MKLALVIVSYNSYDDISSLIASLDNQLRKPDIIIVVDNCSPNGDGSRFEQSTKSQWYRYISADKNGGFAYGCNLGTEYAISLWATHVGYINPDATIGDVHFLEQVERAFTTTSYGIIGTYVISYSSQKIEFGWSKILPFLFYPKVLLKNTVFSGNSVLQIHETDYTTGSSLFFPVSVFEKVGKMDESYFLYFEETDYCLRVRKNGYQIWIISSTCIEHKTSTSVGFRSKLYMRCMIRNYAKFAFKHARWYELPLWFVLYILFWVPGQFVGYLFRKYM